MARATAAMERIVAAGRKKGTGAPRGPQGPLGAGLKCWENVETLGVLAPQEYGESMVVEWGYEIHG